MEEARTYDMACNDRILENKITTAYIHTPSQDTRVNPDADHGLGIFLP